MEALKPIIGSIVRHALTTIGGSGLTVTDDLVSQVVSALLLLGGLALSILKSKAKPV